MRILSHRGYWRTTGEKNTSSAFDRSFSLGFGTETDIRDLAGHLVISHDMPTEGALSVNDFFKSYQTGNSGVELALNIKSDGLQLPLLDLLNEYSVTNYFLFDMSIPDALACLRHGLKCFTRQSEYEPEPAFYSQAAGVWLDGFHGEWWDETLIRRHLDAGKKVCVVSPDLHRRPHLPFWATLAGWSIRSHPNLMLCTDLPEDARDQFRH